MPRQAPFRSCTAAQALAPCCLCWWAFLADPGPASSVGLVWWPQTPQPPPVTVPAQHRSPCWDAVGQYPGWRGHSPAGPPATLSSCGAFPPWQYPRLANLLFYPRVNQSFWFYFSYFQLLDCVLLLPFLIYVPRSLRGGCLFLLEVLSKLAFCTTYNSSRLCQVDFF